MKLSPQTKTFALGNITLIVLGFTTANFASLNTATGTWCTFMSMATGLCAVPLAVLAGIYFSDDLNKPWTKHKVD